MYYIKTFTFPCFRPFSVIWMLFRMCCPLGVFVVVTLSADVLNGS